MTLTNGSYLNDLHARKMLCDKWPGWQNNLRLSDSFVWEDVVEESCLAVILPSHGLLESLHLLLRSVSWGKIQTVSLRFSSCLPSSSSVSLTNRDYHDHAQKHRHFGNTSSFTIVTIVVVMAMRNIPSYQNHVEYDVLSLSGNNTSTVLVS